MAAPRWKTTPCKGCGAPIVWGEDADGKRHPLDPRAPTFLAVQDAVRVQCKRMPDVLVSHFVTCPAANTFSKGSKAKRRTVADEVEAGMKAEADAAERFAAPLPQVTAYAGPALVEGLRKWADEMKRAAGLARDMGHTEIADGNAEVAGLLRAAADLLMLDRAAMEQREGQRTDGAHTAAAGAGATPDGAAPRTLEPVRTVPLPGETAPMVAPGVDTSGWWARRAAAKAVDADPAAMLQAAAGLVNREGDLCGLCDGTNEHVHPQLVCLRCGVVGLDENMRDHVCGRTYGAKPTPSLAFVQVLERNGEGDLCRTCGQTFSHEHHRLACTVCKASGLDVDMRNHRCAAPAPAAAPPEVAADATDPTDPELW